MQSKAIDLGENSKVSWLKRKIYSACMDSELAHWFFNQYRRFITRPIYALRRLYQWHENVLRDDFDFDSGYLYGVIAYKLKRIETCLKKGYAVQDPRDMKALALAIKLAERARADKYEEVFFDRHEKKWGQGIIVWKPSFSYKHPNADTPEKRKQERAESLAGYARAEQKGDRDRKVLFAIIVKYGRYWWD